jgi:hypothetical protein
VGLPRLGPLNSGHKYTYTAVTMQDVRRDHVRYELARGQWSLTWATEDTPRNRVLNTALDPYRSVELRMRCSRCNHIHGRVKPDMLWPILFLDGETPHVQWVRQPPGEIWHGREGAAGGGKPVSSTSNVVLPKRSRPTSRVRFYRPADGCDAGGFQLLGPCLGCKLNFKHNTATVIRRFVAAAGAGCPSFVVGEGVRRAR